jgi:hypothetical protein
MRKIIQGDSDWEDIRRTDGEAMSEDWVGVWAIVPKLGVAPVASGSMTLSDDQYSFYRRTSPVDTAAVPPGKYILVKQISNPSLQFSSEISQEKIEIVEQGIV